MASGSSFNIDVLIDAARALTTLRGLTNAVGSVGSAAVGASVELGKMGAALAAAGIAASIAKTTEQVRDLERASKQLGLSVTTLSQYTVAMRSVGIDAGKTRDILKDMSEKIGEALATGGGEGAEALTLLNLQAADLLRAAPEKRLLMIGQALTKIKSQDTKIFVLEQMASDASLLLPLLDNNAAEFQRLTKAALDSGAAISELDRQRLKPATESMTALGAQFETTGQQIATALAPATDKWATDLRSFLNWVTPAVAELATRFADVAKELGWVSAIGDAAGFSTAVTSGDRSKWAAQAAASNRAALPGQIGSTRAQMASVQSHIDATARALGSGAVTGSTETAVRANLAAMVAEYSRLQGVLDGLVRDFQATETSASDQAEAAAAEAKAREASAQAARDAAVDQGLSTRASAEAAKGQSAADSAHKKALADAAREYKVAQDLQWRIDSDRFETGLKSDEARAKVIDDELTRQFEAEWRRIEAVDAADERRLQALQQQTAEYQRMGSYIGQAIIDGNGMQAIGQVAGSQLDQYTSTAASGWLAQQGMGAAASGMLGGIAGGLAGAAVSGVIGSVFSSETDRVVEQLKQVRQAIINSKGVLSGDRAEARAAQQRADAVFANTYLTQGEGTAALSSYFPKDVVGDASRQQIRAIEAAKTIYSVTQDMTLSIEIATAAFDGVILSFDDIGTIATELQSLFDALPEFEQWLGMTTSIDAASAAIDAFNTDFGQALLPTKESAKAVYLTLDKTSLSGRAAAQALLNLTDEIDTLTGSAKAAALEVGDNGLTGQLDNMMLTLANGINGASKATRVFVDLAAEARRIALDPALSMLKGGQRVEVAQQQFWQLAGVAKNNALSGEERAAAAQQLGGAASTYLQAARERYASGADYSRIYRQVTAQLNAPSIQSFMTGGTAAGGTLVDETSIIGLISKLSKTDSTTASTYLKNLIALVGAKSLTDAADLVKKIADAKLTDAVTASKTVIGELIKTGSIKDTSGLKSVVAELLTTGTLKSANIADVVDELADAGLISKTAADEVAKYVAAVGATGTAASTAATAVQEISRAMAAAALALTPAAGNQPMIDAMAKSFEPVVTELVNSATGGTTTPTTTPTTTATTTQQTSGTAQVVTATTNTTPSPTATTTPQTVSGLLKRNVSISSGYDYARILADLAGVTFTGVTNNGELMYKFDGSSDPSGFAWVRWSRLNADYLAGKTNLQDFRNWGGALKLPSFDVGSPYIPHDQVAQIHRGEMVIDPRSSDALRKYGITVSSDNPATIRVMQEMRDEIVELRRTVSRQSGALAAGVRS